MIKNKLDRIISVGLIFLLMVSVLVPMMATAEVEGEDNTVGASNDIVLTFAGGDGSEGNPWQISNWTHLHEVRDDLTANYTLINNLTTETDGYMDYNDPAGIVGWLPIGNSSDRFTGTFDGQGFEISDLYINRPTTDYTGLFGYIDTGGEVRNVGVVDGAVSGYDNVGGLVGRNDYGTVENSYATGNVSGVNHQVGGLVGYNRGGTVENSYSTGAVSGEVSVGGLVGFNYEGTVSNSYAAGDVDGNDNVGGLVGYNRYATVSNSYATGTVSGNLDVGGLVGRNRYATVSNSYATGTVSGNGRVGGLVGWNDGTVENSYATGTVSGTNRVGGLVGLNWGGTVNNSYATGDVSGDEYVGGLVARNHFGTASNSYATGTVTRISGSTNSDFGGFVGENYQGKVINCYSTGSVHYTGATDPTDKGFAGSVYIGGDYEMTGNFWDIETSGQTGTFGNATGKTTAEMMDITTFSNAGWDIIHFRWYTTEAWYIKNCYDYPRLGWENLTYDNYVVETIPQDGGKAINITINVTVIFSWSLNTSVTPTLTQTEGTIVSYTFSHWDTTCSDNDTAVWTHDDWEEDEVITLNVSGYENTAGDVGDPYDWNFFTTGTTPCNITDLTPTDPETGQSFIFEANVTHITKISSVHVYYYTDVTAPTNVTMTDIGSDIYQRTITVPTTATSLHYNISALAVNGVWNDTGETTLTVTDVIPPVITDNSPITATAGQIYTWNATVTDNINVHSVYVEYYFEYYYETDSPTNTTMSNSAIDYYERAINVPNHAYELHYLFTARDDEDNWQTTTLTTIPVSEEFAPTITDNSPGVAYTDATFTFNATVQSTTLDYVRVRYWINLETPSNDTMNNVADTFYWTRNYTIPSNAQTLTYEIMAKDTAGNFVTTGITSFAVTDNINPTSTCDSPEFTNRLTISISYSATDNIDVHNVSLYYILNATTWEYYDTQTSASGTFTFTAPNLGTYRFRTIATDTSDNTETKVGYDTETIIDTTVSLDVTIDIPADGLSTNNADVYFEWSSTNYDIVDNYQIRIGTGVWQDMESNVSGTFTLPDGDVIFRVRAYDFEDYYAEDSITVTVDATSPEVTNWSPKGDGVAQDSELWVYFNEDMNTAINPSLTQLSGTYADGWYFDEWETSRKAVWQPNGEYPSEDEITLNITGAQDTAGNTMISHEWYFTVVDTVPPEVLITTPGDGDINVSYNVIIVIVFNEQMNTAHRPVLSVQTGTNPGSWVFQGWSTTNVQYDTIMWTHGGFRFNQEVTLRVTSYYDGSGNLGSPHDFTFETETDWIPPQVILTTPDTNEHNVPYKEGQIRIVFDEEINSTVGASLLLTANETVLNTTLVKITTTFRNNDTVIFSYEDLPSDVTITATVSDYEDVYGNGDDEYTWEFSTARSPADNITLATVIMIALFGAVVAVAIIVLIVKVLGRGSKSVL